MIKYLLGCFMFFFSLQVDGSKIADTYISKYKDIAVTEMSRTGIPASIKLAQGLLESNWGRSELAITANNHFGIKCGGRWNGEGYYLKDDDRDQNGNLTPSCFRVFGSVDESYIAHSEFLTSEDRTGRYAFLFEYSITDYRSWAKGLKKAGYATDKQYPNKLITIIEKYQLYEYDQYIPGDHPATEIVDNHSSGLDGTDDVSRNSRLKPHTSLKSHYKTGKYIFSTINDVRVTTAHGGETLEELAAKTGADIDDLMNYNEEYGYRTMVLKPGDIVYFKKKKRAYKGIEEFHVFTEGETMFSVSQQYGIKMANLYAKNKMPKGAEPLSGSRLYLKRSAPKDDRPSYTKHPIRNEEVEFLFADAK